jgi:uncharacterized membrane protein
MAAFAYILLPVTGLIAYLTGRDQRVRMHGLQAIAIGLLWPLCLYAAGLGPVAAVQGVFVAFTLVWLGFLLLTLLGRDPRLPVLGKRLAEMAGASTKDERRNTSGSSTP